MMMFLLRCELRRGSRQSSLSNPSKTASLLRRRRRPRTSNMTYLKRSLSTFLSESFLFLGRRVCLEKCFREPRRVRERIQSEFAGRNDRRRLRTMLPSRSRRKNTFLRVRITCCSCTSHRCCSLSSKKTFRNFVLKTS